jgi:hypothetical protein
MDDRAKALQAGNELFTVDAVSCFPVGLPLSRTWFLIHPPAITAGFPPSATDRLICSHTHPQHVALVILGKIQTQPVGREYTI